MYLHSHISNTFVELARGHTCGFLWVCTLNALPDTLSWTMPRTVSMARLSVTIPGARLFHNQSLEKHQVISILILQEQHTTLWQFDRGLGQLKPCLPSNSSPVTNLLSAVLLPEAWKTQVGQAVNATARLLLGKRSSRIPTVSYRDPWASSWTSHLMAGTAALTHLTSSWITPSPCCRRGRLC